VGWTSSECSLRDEYLPKKKKKKTKRCGLRENGKDERIERGRIGYL
jgi:hypothetical protein